MAEASLLAGLAISHSRTALCHSISYPITAHFGVPHGLACAFTMSAVLRFNLPADDGRFTELAQAITGQRGLDGLIARFDQLHSELRIRARVQSFVPSLGALMALESQMYAPTRAANNLRPVHDVKPLLAAAWGE